MQVVQGVACHLAVLHHRIQRERSCTVVVDKAKVDGVRFGNGVDGHAIHPREQYIPHGGGIASARLFVFELCPVKGEVFLHVCPSWWFMVRGRETSL